MLIYEALFKAINSMVLDALTCRYLIQWVSIFSTCIAVGL